MVDEIRQIELSDLKTLVASTARYCESQRLSSLINGDEDQGAEMSSFLERMIKIIETPDSDAAEVTRLQSELAEARAEVERYRNAITDACDYEGACLLRGLPKHECICKDLDHTNQSQGGSTYE